MNVKGKYKRLRGLVISNDYPEDNHVLWIKPAGGNTFIFYIFDGIDWIPATQQGGGGGGVALEDWQLNAIKKASRLKVDGFGNLFLSDNGNYKSLDLYLSDVRNNIASLNDRITNAEDRIGSIGSGLDLKADKSSVPTKVGQLVNDKGYITKDDVPAVSGYATKEYVDSSVDTVSKAIPTNVSQLENDKNYVDNKSFKTINGQSVIGSGDIEIKPGTDVIYDISWFTSASSANISKAKWAEFINAVIDHKLCCDQNGFWQVYVSSSPNVTEDSIIELFLYRGNEIIKWTLSKNASSTNETYDYAVASRDVSVIMSVDDALYNEMANKVGIIKTDGDGTKYLNDKGEYVAVSSNIIIDSGFNSESTNAVQNKVVTQAITELQDYCFPTSLEASVSPSSVEWTGSPVEVSVSYRVIRNSNPVEVNLIQISFNSEQKRIENVSNGSEKFIIKSQGYKSGTVTAKKESVSIKNSPRSIGVNLYLPVYLGFSNAVSGDQLVITDLTKGGVSINGTKNLSNDDATKYLWLCVPDTQTINKVTSGGFDIPFLTPVEASTSLGTYKCYRTKDFPGAGGMTIVIS